MKHPEQDNAVNTNSAHHLAARASLTVDPRKSVLGKDSVAIKNQQQAKFGFAQEDQLADGFFVHIADAQQRANFGDLPPAVVAVLVFAAPIRFIQIFLIGGFGAAMSQNQAIAKNL